MNSSNAWTDWLGIVASVACAIHCAAMPFVVAFLPLMGLSFLADESFHKVMVVVCALVAAAAFIPGIKRHRRLLPIGVAAIGLAMISTAAFALEGECCPACESVPIVTATGLGGPVCTDECCAEEVEASASSPAESESATPSETPMLGVMTTWMTPLGGLLLVSAHLTNRRFSCRDGCC